MNEEHSRLNFVVIDRRTAWDLFSLKAPSDYEIVDREEGYEMRDGLKIDYRKIIFKTDDRYYLLSGAVYAPDPTQQIFSFFLYAEERWSDDDADPVSCPEVQNA